MTRGRCNRPRHEPSHPFLPVCCRALDAAVPLGGQGLEPFYNLLDGGRDGDFFRELEDYFYYAQLRSHGIDTMETRQVSTHIPLEEVPFVMRAMGFYPSEEQIEEMLNEVKFSEYVDTGKQVTKINLGDFIKLYINHRPAFGLSMKKIRRAFQVLGYDNEKGEKVIDRGDLLLLLQRRGWNRLPTLGCPVRAVSHAGSAPLGTAARTAWPNSTCNSISFSDKQPAPNARSRRDPFSPGSTFLRAGAVCFAWGRGSAPLSSRILSQTTPLCSCAAPVRAAGAAASLEEDIPDEITAEIFTADILGLPIPEPKSEAEERDEPLLPEGSQS